MTSNTIEPKHETSIHRILRDAAFRLSPLTDGIMIKHQVDGTEGGGTFISSISTDAGKGVQINIGGEISPILAAALLKARDVVKVKTIPPIMQTRALRQSVLTRAIEQAQAYERAERATIGFERGTMTPAIKDVKIDGVSAAEIEARLKNILPAELKAGNLHVIHTGDKWKFTLSHTLKEDEIPEQDQRTFEKIRTLRNEVDLLNTGIKVQELQIPTNHILNAGEIVRSHDRHIIKTDGEYRVYDRFKLLKFKPPSGTREDAIKALLKNNGHEGEVKIEEGQGHLFVTTITPVKLNDLSPDVRDKVEVAGDAYEELTHALSRVERPWLYVKRANEAERIGITEKTDATPNTKPMGIPAITKLAQKLGAIPTGRRTGLWLDLDKDGATLNSEFRLSVSDVRPFMAGVSSKDFEAQLASRFNATNHRAAGNSEMTVSKDGDEWVLRTSKRFDHSNLSHEEHAMLKDTVRNYEIARDDSETALFHASPEIDVARTMASRLCAKLLSSSSDSERNIGFGFRVLSKKHAWVSLVFQEALDDPNIKTKVNSLMEQYKLTGTVHMQNNVMSFLVDLKTAHNPALVKTAAESHVAFDEYRKALVANSELQIGKIAS